MQHSILWYTIIQHNYKRIYVCMCVCTYVGTNVFVFVFLPAFVSSHIACLWLSFMSFFSPFFVAMSSLAHSLSLSLCLSLCVFSPVLDNKEGVAVSACVFLLLTACVCVWGFCSYCFLGPLHTFSFLTTIATSRSLFCCQHCFQYFWVLDGVYCLCWPQAPET